MLSWNGPRWRNTLRVLALALLVLSMVARPVLAAIGEAHELAHDPSGRHAHVIEADRPAVDAAPEERSVGHALLHFAHCCAQLSVAMADGLFIPAVMPRSSLAVRPEVAPPGSGARVSPFRPPIAG